MRPTAIYDQLCIIALPILRAQSWFFLICILPIFWHRILVPLFTFVLFSTFMCVRLWNKCRECRERFPTDMHHGTCVTHVPWCMPESLTSDFLWSRWREKAYQAFPVHAQAAILHIWDEAHCSTLLINNEAAVPILICWSVDSQICLYMLNCFEIIECLNFRLLFFLWIEMAHANGICPLWRTAVHFTNDFSIVIQVRWKFHSALVEVALSGPYRILPMAQQLWCRGICIILLR